MVFIGSFDLFFVHRVAGFAQFICLNCICNITYWYRDLLLLFVFLQRLLSASVVRLESSSSRCARAFTP